MFSSPSDTIQKELEKYLHKSEDLTGTPPTSLKKGKDGSGTGPGGSALALSGTKAKDSNLIDNLGQGRLYLISYRCMVLSGKLNFHMIIL